METFYGYAGIKKEEKNNIIKLIKQYTFNWILIGIEQKDGVHALTNGEHIHFLYETSRKTHDAFKKSLIRHYNLGSKNQSDKSSYGFPNKKIEDLDKLKAYTLKDLDYYTEGITTDEIESIKKLSFPKEDKKDDTIEAAEYLHSNLSEFQLTDEYDEEYNLINCRHHNFDFRMMENIIFRHFRKNNNKKVITYHRIHYVGSYYLQNYHEDKEEDNIQYLKKRF